MALLPLAGAASPHQTGSGKDAAIPWHGTEAHAHTRIPLSSPAHGRPECAARASRDAFPGRPGPACVVVFGIVGVVLFGGGFWSEGKAGQLHAQGATETITIAPTDTEDTNRSRSPSPVGKTVINAPSRPI